LGNAGSLENAAADEDCCCCWYPGGLEATEAEDAVAAAAKLPLALEEAFDAPIEGHWLLMEEADEPPTSATLIRNSCEHHPAPRTSDCCLWGWHSFT